MEHLLLKATTVAADEGTFEAVISTASVDRDGDIVEPKAIVAALAKWADLGKLVPLAWDHTKNVIGHIDPASARVEGQEVVAAGRIDQEATGPNGENFGELAWRLVKSGTLSFSYGMLIPEGGAKKRAGGGLHITALDMFEVSVIPVAPSNNDTRILSWKSVEERDRVIADLQEVKDRLAKAEKALEDLTTNAEAGKETKSRPVDPLKDRAMTVALEIETDGIGPEPPAPQGTKEMDRNPGFDPDELRQRSRDLMIQVLSGTE